MLNMKKLLSLLLVLCLFAPTALAGEEGFYYPYSVVSCEQTNSDYDKFYRSGEFSIVVPGVHQNYVPQGIAYYGAQNQMIFSGYSSDKTASTLIAVDMQNNYVMKEIFLKNPDGSFYTGHAGGVCITEKNIFVSGEGCLYRIPLSAFNAAPASSAYTFAEVIPVPCKASYCQVSDGILWVGEFYEPNDPKNHTDKSHHIKTKDGRQKSWLMGYKLTGATENELDPACLTSQGAVPDYIFSTTEKIQGVTFCDNTIILSQSYGRDKHSALYKYENMLTDAPNSQVNVLGTQRPIWFLDSDSWQGVMVCPPMTEGLCTIDGSIYVSFESAAKTYRDPKDPSEKPSVNPIDRLVKLSPDAINTGHTF